MFAASATGEGVASNLTQISVTESSTWSEGYGTVTCIELFLTKIQGSIQLELLNMRQNYQMYYQTKSGSIFVSNIVEVDANYPMQGI